LKKRAVDLYRGKQAGDILGDWLIQEILKDPDLRPFDADTGNYDSFWVVDRDWDNRRSLITDPADGRIPPLTEQAKGSRRERQGPSGPPAGPEDVSLSVRCITYGVPRISAGYNSYFEIRQSAGYVTITQEMIHDVRIIPLDGRPHVGKNIRLIFIGFNFNGARLLGSGSVDYTDRAFWSDVLSVSYCGFTDPYTLVNGSFGVEWAGGRVTTLVKVNNLLNRAIQQHVFGDIIKRSVVADVRVHY
jgi:hypothetical protein